MASEPLLSARDAGGQQIFQWNWRRCHGNDLHLAVLTGDQERVLSLLKADPGLVESRYSYQATATQEGSGQAIHLAASRGHLEILKDLIAHSASLTSSVTRNHKPYYDAFHAAIIAEGRGGEDHVIKFLLPKVELQRNSEGKHPLHVAFALGKPSLVCLIRSWMEKKEKGKCTEAELASGEVVAPLRLGIQTMKMTWRELILCADTTALSLRIFMDDAPRAVPLFLKRLDNLGMQRKASFNTKIRVILV